MIDINIVIERMKKFDWQQIINKGAGLDAFNDAQWKFLKGFIVEMLAEKYCNGELVAVREDHKDYDWPSLGLTVELKSTLAASMFNKNGSVKKNYSVIFNNSRGTNSLSELPDEHVTDILLVIKNDGAFIVDRETVKKYAVSAGDGFKVNIPGSEIIDVSGKIHAQPEDMTHVKEKIIQVIKESV